MNAKTELTGLQMIELDRAYLAYQSNESYSALDGKGLNRLEMMKALRSLKIIRTTFRGNRMYTTLTPFGLSLCR